MGTQEEGIQRLMASFGDKITKAEELRTAGTAREQDSVSCDSMENQSTEITKRLVSRIFNISYY